MRRPEGANFFGRDPGYRFLRAKGNSIEGGTSEILRNIIAERVLGLPQGNPGRQGRAMEGPAPVTAAMAHVEQAQAAARSQAAGPSAGRAADLLYGETENELRAAVRELLADRAGPADVLARTETGETYDTGLWHALAAEVGCAGLLIAESHGGAGATLPGGGGRRRGSGPGGRAGAVPRQRGRGDRGAAVRR